VSFLLSQSGFAEGVPLGIQRRHYDEAGSRGALFSRPARRRELRCSAKLEFSRRNSSFRDPKT
jgi:hypothetical protein